MVAEEEVAGEEEAVEGGSAQGLLHTQDPQVHQGSDENGINTYLELRLELPLIHLTNDHVQQLLDLELTTILLHCYTYFHSHIHIVISDKGLVQDHGSPDHHQDHPLHPRQLVHGHQAEVPEAIITTNLTTALLIGSESPITTQPTTGVLDIFLL